MLKLKHLESSQHFGMLFTLYLDAFWAHIHTHATFVLASITKPSRVGLEITHHSHVASD